MQEESDALHVAPDPDGSSVHRVQAYLAFLPFQAFPVAFSYLAVAVVVVVVHQELLGCSRIRPYPQRAWQPVVVDAVAYTVAEPSGRYSDPSSTSLVVVECLVGSQGRLGFAEIGCSWRRSLRAVDREVQEEET